MVPLLALICLPSQSKCSLWFDLTCHALPLLLRCHVHLADDTQTELWFQRQADTRCMPCVMWRKMKNNLPLHVTVGTAYVIACLLISCFAVAVMTLLDVTPCRDSFVMQRALDTHDTVLRALLARYYGYEVTTEGDSFTMAFHDPVDAVTALLPALLHIVDQSSQTCFCSAHLTQFRSAPVRLQCLLPLCHSANEKDR